MSKSWIFYLQLFELLLKLDAQGLLVFNSSIQRVELKIFPGGRGRETRTSLGPAMGLTGAAHKPRTRDTRERIMVLATLLLQLLVQLLLVVLQVHDALLGQL